MKMSSKSQLQKKSKAALMLFVLIGFLFSFVFLLSGCGGGGNTAPPPKENVLVKGTVIVDSQTSPVAGALCRFVDSQGVEQAVASADDAGAFTLKVPADIDGHIRCSPTGLDNLSLSAYCSTQGAAPGDTLEDEDVTIYTTLAAQIMATEDPADPAGRNAELLAAMDGGQDPDLNLVVKVATRLYSAMLDHNLDVTFANDAIGTPADGNSISGQVDAGGQSPDSGETAVLADAQCTFIADNNLGDGGSLLYPFALADFYDDGRLSRSDLAAIHTEINEQNIGQEEEIAQGFKRVFTASLGPAYTTTTDADGIYSMAVPPNVSGYVRCVPKERQSLVVAAYVPGRPKGESLEGQDVNPATTLHAHRIAARLRNLTEQSATKENYIKDISGLETEVLYDNQAVAGFQLRSGTTPAEKNVGLAAFSATALYNLLYRSNTGGDYLALLDAFCRERGLDPEAFADQGLTSEESRAFSELLSQAIAQTQSTLGTLLDDALSTARINLTVSDVKGGQPLAGATVTLADDIACIGCSGHTNGQGGITLNVAGLTDPTKDITIVVQDAEGHEAVETVRVVPLATVDTSVAMFASHTLTIQQIGDGSGEVYTEIDGNPIDCEDNDGEYKLCAMEVAHGATVTLTAATPYEGNVFDGWQGNACNHAEPVCTVTMDQDQTVTAVFSRNCSNADFHDFLSPRWGETFASSGGNGAIKWADPNVCNLAANSDVDWITLGTVTMDDSADSGYVDNLRSLAYTVAANPDPHSRTGTVMVFEHPIVITQDGQQCAAVDYEISPASTIFTPSGGTGAIEVRAPGDCPWDVASHSDWITITSGTGEHRGSGTVTYTVPENPGANERVGDIHLLGKHHVVAQGGVSWPQVHGVTIQAEGNGSGTVFSNLTDVTGHNSRYQDIECQITNDDAEGKCHAVFRSNTIVQLCAMPDDGSIFVNWTGACTNSYEYCDFRVSAETPTVGARFMRPNEAELLLNGWSGTIDEPLHVGETFHFNGGLSVGVENRGIENAGSFSVGLYISSDQSFDATDTLIADSRIRVEGLAAGEEQFFDLPQTITIPANLAPGRAYLGVVVDDLNEVTEDIEDNNAFWVEVELLAPEDESRGGKK